MTFKTPYYILPTPEPYDAAAHYRRIKKLYADYLLNLPELQAEYIARLVRDLPERYGPWQTVYDRFNRWRKDGTWAKILDALLLRLDDDGLIDRDLWCVDASVIRASRSAGGAGKKSRQPAGVGRA